MDKKSHRIVKLSRGEVLVFNFGSIRLHNYSSNDPMLDQVMVFDRGGTAVAIENPSFRSSGREFAEYLRRKGVYVVGKLLAYHMCGASFLPDVLAYSTARADVFGHSGPGAEMVAQFAAYYGDDFDADINDVNELVEPGWMRIDGFGFELVETADAFDVILPELHILYTHMLGGDTHSIVHSKRDLDATIARLTVYYRQDYDLVLSSHHTPENSSDIRAKIDYLRELDAQARAADNAEELMKAMLSSYPTHKNIRNLEMTANALLG